LRALADPIFENHPDLRSRWGEVGEVFDDTTLADARTRDPLTLLVHAFERAGVFDVDA
jgi:hypothetical protein